MLWIISSDQTFSAIDRGYVGIRKICSPCGCFLNNSTQKRVEPNKTASGTALAIINTLKNIKSYVKSITVDQGGEFNKYPWIKDCIGADFYFCEPSSYKFEKILELFAKTAFLLLKKSMKINTANADSSQIMVLLNQADNVHEFANILSLEGCYDQALENINMCINIKKQILESD